jgi:hypothetical protein
VSPTPASARRRWLWIAAGVLLVALLSGGRWLALETAERAWAASITGGDVYLEGRQLGRLLRGLVFVVAVLWTTGNLLVVYRAIGSVQMPRRLGDLEIVEAVPGSVLCGTTVACGVLLGLLLTLGTGGWWLTAALAHAPPTFGLLDPILQRDAGYYVGSLPWSAALQDRVLTAVAVVTTVVALLYYGIGSLRRVEGEWRASPHARGHLGMLLAALAVALAWGALLDPAEVVGGLHGRVDRAVLDFRVAGAPMLAAVAVATALASLAWAGLGRSNLLLGGWALLGAGSLLVYAMLPAMGRGARGRDGGRVAELEALAPVFSDVAFGPRGGIEPPPTPPSLDAAVATVPLWDPLHVAAVVRHRGAAGSHATVQPAGVVLAGARQWLAVPAPHDSALRVAQPAADWTASHRGPWARAGPPLIAHEVDSGLALAPAPLRDGELWFGAGFSRFAVVHPDSHAAARAAGVPLRGVWRRAALAWSLQSPELARRVSDGLHLLWRRDATERLSRLAPFATFEAPRPVLLDGTLWWLSYGYVASATFPLVAAAPWDGARARYVRPGLVGAVQAATGETRLFAAPAMDSLTAAWTRIFAPLVAPHDSMPPLLRAQLLYPGRAFGLAVTRWREAHGDTATWTTRPTAPYQLLAPSRDGTVPRVWTGQGFEVGTPPRLTALLAGAVTPRGPVLLAWRPEEPVRLPPPVAGSPHVRTGPERLWVVEGAPFALQAQFDEPAGEAPRLRSAWISWGDRSGAGPTGRLALRDLLTAGAREAPSAERWEEARRLLAQADSALAVGDLERFGRLYTALKQVLAVGRRELAPPGRLR